MSDYKYLTVDGDAKTRKGSAFGYYTGVFYLAPADSAGLGFSICVNAGNCKFPCLNSSGRAKFDVRIQQARIRRTRELFADRATVLAMIAGDIEKLVRRAKKRGLIPAVRLNGTSDLYWLVKALRPLFPTVQFYDYTKLDRPWTRVASNYHLTFSWDGEENYAECLEALAHGINVAVPFNLKPKAPLPATWRGFRVIDGDLSDLRFLDETGVIVGLRVKSVSKERKTAGVNSGFVQIALAS